MIHTYTSIQTHVIECKYTLDTALIYTHTLHTALIYTHTGENPTEKRALSLYSLFLISHIHAHSLPHTDPLKPHSALFNWTLEQRTAASGSC